MMSPHSFRLEFWDEIPSWFSAWIGVRHLANQHRRLSVSIGCRKALGMSLLTGTTASQRLALTTADMPSASE